MKDPRIQTAAATVDESPKTAAVSPRERRTAGELDEVDIDTLMRRDETLSADQRRLTFNVYGKADADSFMRILYRGDDEFSEPERTNYVQCTICAKVLVAKLSGAGFKVFQRCLLLKCS